MKPIERSATHCLNLPQPLTLNLAYAKAAIIARDVGNWPMPMVAIPT